MAINSVSGMSNVAFRANAMDKVSPELMSSPGMYASETPVYAEREQPQKKEGSALGSLVKLVAGAVIVLGGGVAARKLVMKEYKVAEKLPEGAKFGEKVKHYFAKYTDKVYDSVANLFKKTKGETKAAPEAEPTK